MTKREKVIERIATMTDQEASALFSFLAKYDFDTAAALEALKKERGITE